MKGLLFLLLSCWPVSTSRCHDPQEVIYTVEGHAFTLFCHADQPEGNLTYIWSKDNHTLKETPRIKFQKSSMWFLKTVLSDSGKYRCISTNSSVTMDTALVLSVERGPCPRPSEVTVIRQGSNVSFPCTEDRVPTLGQALQVQWWKDCKSTGMQGREISFVNMSMSGMGNYTCMVNFTYEGKTYTASHTLELTVLQSVPEEKPVVICPHGETVRVKPGEKLKLNCTALVGAGHEALLDATVYWIINNSYSQKYPQFIETATFEWKEDSNLYGHSTLTISEVLPEFFGMPFKCIVLTPSGIDTGVVYLSQDDDHTIQTIMMICLLIVVMVVGTVLFMLFKVDIILACRDLCGKGKAANQDSKLYNAYVSCYPGNGPSSTRAEDLALRHLPAILEQQHHLRLFIQGRDDTDTEVNLSAMTDAISQSRTVVLILPSSIPANQEDQVLIALSQGQVRLNASQREDLCSAIAQCSVPVILIECEKNADHSLLPETIQTTRQRQGVLRWKPTVRPSGRFWKHLRYRMT